MRRNLLFSTALCTGLYVFAAGPAAAQTVEDRVARLEALVRQQADQIDVQQRELAAQRAEIEARGSSFVTEARAPRSSGALPTPRSSSSDGPIVTGRVEPAVPDSRDQLPVGPDEPVGQAPPAATVEVASMPEGAGVLTPRGHLTLEPSVDFTHGSTNRLVFRGVEIVTGIQIGVIEASDADRDAYGVALSARYGLTDRIEIEGRLPYIWRADRVTTLAQRSDQVTRTLNLRGENIGDVEGSIRYQVNTGRDGLPVFTAGLRVKSDTGTSPFEIDRDQFGVASELATGSGFWAVEGSLSALYPTDPAVLFANIAYLYHIPKNVDRTVGDVTIGRVDPGDSFSVAAGFGFALNPRFSFSLAYRHSYITATESELNGVPVEAESLQVGALTLGASYQLTPRITLSSTVEIGVTRDAPDVRVVFRVPYRF